jgi:3-hydroxymyristoyl/3-hydroxydecanoyl-(acyl carrier protein) dehydratase
MNLPPFDIARRAPDEAWFELHLAADHPAFRGHFPGTPVLAGVIQIDWAMQLAQAQFGLQRRAAEDFRVKYSRIVSPAGRLSLHLRLDRAAQRLLFEYRLDGEAATLGQVRLGET